MRQIHAGCARHIRESDANVARTFRAKQGMLLLDPSPDQQWRTQYVIGERIHTCTDAHSVSCLNVTFIHDLYL
jgi:hypothetical protein